MDRFETTVHPDDLELVRHAIGSALGAGEPVNVEYRIRAGGGRLRWILSRGRPYFKSTGEPDRLLGVSSRGKDIERRGSLYDYQANRL
jgi:PAS domain-containing protein